MLGLELRARFDDTEFLKPFFIGILGAEELITKLGEAAAERNPCFCVVNTDTTNENGSHWFCVFQHSPWEYDVLDSLGITLEEAKARLGADDSVEINFNISRVQAENSNQCGEFCYFFCCERMSNLELPFDEVFHDCFSADLNLNENHVSTFWKTGLLPDL
jgi:hypothetical protein